jgi:hypothetical protein
LVTSIPPSVYRNLPPVPARQTPGGGWLLFAYLRYAEVLAEAYEHIHEQLSESAGDTPAQIHVRSSQTPSPFVHALAQRLADQHRVGSDLYWGNEGFCVDVALRHPHRPDEVTIGILCDSTRFTQAEDPVEWDLFRTNVLESQGWNLHRIWTPHFFRDPNGCMQTILRQAEKEACQAEKKDALRVEKKGGLR